MTRKIYYFAKTLCYTGIGIVLHLANIHLTSFYFWGIVFLALAIDLLSGWLVIEQVRYILKGDDDGSSESST